jgi:CMP-N-acetylneuraminic acid synthetase
MKKLMAGVLAIKENNKTMRTVALLPIKLDSERVRGKNVKPFFDGTPLMAFIQRACLAAKNINETYIYCSNEQVKSYLLDGVRFLDRPKWLDGNNVNSNDIIREFIKEIDADVYLETHATSPFTKPDTLNAVVEKVASGEFDSAFLAESLREFLWQDGKPLNFDPQHFPRTQDLTPIYAESSGAFVFTKATFQKYDRRVGVNPYIHEIDSIEAVDIDYPIDFEIANAIYKEIICNERSN